MKHCQQCNLSFPDNYKFCGSCGHALSDSITCLTCGEIIESKWKFCTGCGMTVGTGRVQPAAASGLAENPRTPAPVAPASQPISPGPLQREEAKASAPEWYAAPELFEKADETTSTSMRAAAPPTEARPIVPLELAPVAAGNGANHSLLNGKRAPTLTMLSAYGQSAEPAAPLETQGRYPIFLAVLIVFFAMLGFGGWYLWSHRTVVAASPTNIDSSSAQTQSATSNGLSAASRSEIPAERAITANYADEDLKGLRERRISAQPSERAAILASLEQAEKKYPTDYRFPYERSKLSIKGITSHDEAFGALSAAAEKAIDNGKAQEMLDNLNADKDGDFYKLARGHHEWHALMDALSNKDKRDLTELHHRASH